MRKLFFIFTLICTLSHASGQALVPVRDTDGNFLLAGTSYYILPVIHGKGGGVTLAPRRNQTCPFDVVQENNELKKGLPLNFVHAYNTSKDRIIHERTDLNIIFSGAYVSTCIQTAVWWVEYYDGERILSSQGTIGSPGWQTIRNRFKIEKYEGDYKLVHCPTTCKDCRPPYCADIGSTIAKNGHRILVLNNVPLKVMFKKA